MNKLKIAVWTVVMMLFVLALSGWQRQARIVKATRQWEDAGGGIHDMELPLLGPHAVFAKLNESSNEEQITNLRNAATALCRTCSPEFELRWESQDGKLAIASDRELITFCEILKGSGAQKVVIRRGRFTIPGLIAFLTSIESINLLIVPKDSVTKSELAEVNKLLGRDVLRHR